MRSSIRDFVEICVKHLPPTAPVIEFGALQVSGSPEEDLRPLFEGLEYIGSDLRSGPGVDRILDLHDIELPDASVGCVVCVDTLEHVEYPREALREMHRILEPGGMLILTSVFSFPIHNYPHDFWRFTPEGFKSLLKIFETRFVGSFGLSEDSPQSVVGIGIKCDREMPEAFLEDYGKWAHWNSAVCRKLASEDQT